MIVGLLITSYFDIVRHTIKDTIPKAIMHYLVNAVKESLHNRLVSLLYKEELFTELLTEDENIQKERNKCKAMLELYKRASSIIAEAY